MSNAKEIKSLIEKWEQEQKICNDEKFRYIYSQFINDAKQLLKDCDSDVKWRIESFKIKNKATIFKLQGDDNYCDNGECYSGDELLNDNDDSVKSGFLIINSVRVLGEKEIVLAVNDETNEGKIIYFEIDREDMRVHTDRTPSLGMFIQYLPI